MNTGKSKPRMRILFRLLLSNLAVLIIPVFVGSLVYHEAFKIAASSTRQTNLVLLEQCRSVLDARMSEVDAMIVRVSLDSRISELLEIDHRPETSEMIKLYQTMRQLNMTNYNNSMVKNFIIYFKDSGIMITPNFAQIDEELLFGETFKYNNMDWQNWLELMFKEHYNRNALPSIPVHIDEKSFSAVSYLQTLPLQYPNQTKAIMLTLLDEKEFLKLLNPLHAGNGGWVCIVDAKGNILTSISDKSSKIIPPLEGFSGDSGYMESYVEGKKMNISYTKSKYNGWTYVAATPTAVIMQQVYNIKRTTLIIATGTLIIGLLISCYLAYRNSKPLKDIINSLKAFLGGDTNNFDDEYDFLKGNITKLIDGNVKLRDTLQQQNPLLRTAFFDRLLKGEFRDAAELKEFMGHTGIHIYGDCYTVMIITICGYENTQLDDGFKELNTERDIIDKFLCRRFEGKVCIYALDRNKVLMILGLYTNTAGRQDDCLRDCAESIYYELYNQYNLKVIITAGGLSDSLEGISHSYQEALQAMAYSMEEVKSPVITYQSIPSRDNSYYYLPESEIRLMNLARAGNGIEVNKTLEELFDENFKKRKLSPEMSGQFLAELKGTIIKILSQLQDKEDHAFSRIREEVSKINVLGDRKEVYRSLAHGLIDICAAYDNQKKSHNLQLKDSIVEHLNRGYMDPNLCLSSIAEKFQLSEVYISQFYKEQTGDNFSTCLEKIRIKHACSHLLNTGMTVDDIACSVGYNSSDTFRKAFKRITGLSPASFRKSNKSLAIL